jgi:cysteine desulfurase
MNQPIYLDYNASTPIAPEVIAAMQPFLTDHYGNPSSLHWAGTGARNAVEDARVQVAGLIGSDPSEIIFTSGGTEANNHALKGVVFATRGKGDHIITSAVEHPSVVAPCRFLESLGARITVLPVDRFGRVDPDDVRMAVTSETVIISVMHANNEVGTIQPIADIARIAKEAGILFHTDAAQSAGKIPADVNELGIDLLSIAGHKLYAPKGIGALYIRKGTELVPLIHGAGHEQGRRAGTENVLLAVGLGTACSIAEKWTGMHEVQALRDRFWRKLQETFGKDVTLNGHPTERLPNTLNVTFVGRSGADLLKHMPSVAASTGSACHSGSAALSPVLAAMGIAPEVGMGAVRFSLGRYTTEEEIEEVLALLRNMHSKS